MRAFKPALCSQHDANHGCRCCLALSLCPRIPFLVKRLSFGKDLQKEESKRHGTRFTVQTSKGKSSLLLLGNGITNRSGAEMSGILIMLSSHSLLSVMLLHNSQSFPTYLHFHLILYNIQHGWCIHDKHVGVWGSTPILQIGK